MRRQEMQGRKKVNAHKRGKKRPQMGGCSRKRITFAEHKTEVITNQGNGGAKKRMKSPFSVSIFFRIRTKGDT